MLVLLGVGCGIETVQMSTDNPGGVYDFVYSL